MKRFKKYIEETPQINTFLDKKVMDKIRDQYVNHIKQNHKNAVPLEKDKNTFTLKDNGSTHYYRMNDDNEPLEISSFDANNVQKHVSKGNGSSKQNIDFMKSHANNFGEVVSDSSNTEGSKKIWKSLISSPEESFSIHHKHKGTENEVTADYLKNNEHKIWNKSMDSFDHKLILRKK